MRKIFRFLWHIPRNLLIEGVLLYQKLFSPDHSFWSKAVKPDGFCKFHPTCSKYMEESLRKYGFIKGLSRGIWRIGRCNPWSDGGVDKP